MKMTALFFAILLPLDLSGASQQGKRSIDRCAQDGTFFYGVDDSSYGPSDQYKPGKQVLIERDGATVGINYGPTSTHLSLALEGTQLTSDVKGLDPALGYLTVSAKAFALSWSPNSHAWSTQLFVLTPEGKLAENTLLISSAEKTFVADAHKFCKTPGAETSAIKWLDKTHLLIAIDAWTTGFCNSNFTEGFILDVAHKKIERKLSNSELINLPAVCTWNLVPSRP